MNRWVATGLMIVGCASCIAAQQPAATLTSLDPIHKLTNAQAAQQLPVDFEATVTYYRYYERTLFVQDGPNAIYVMAPQTSDPKFTAGDRVRIEGTTRGSFHPIVVASRITFLRHAGLPIPPTAHYSDLAHARFDSLLVKVRAHIVSADITVSSDLPSTRLSMLVDGSPGEAYVDTAEAGTLSGLIDADVDLTGVSSGRFDGKMEMTGVVLHLQNLSQLKIVNQAAQDPWKVPLTPVEDAFQAYNTVDLSNRIHVEGIITYYIPGYSLVLQNGTRSIWVDTYSRQPFQIGDYAEVIGFPDVHDGFVRLHDGEIRLTGRSGVIQPVHTSWTDLSQSHHIFETVSVDALVVAEVREAARDVYVLSNEGHIFSAIYRHPERRVVRSLPLEPLKVIQPGSRVRAVGVCIVEDPNPYNGSVPVDLMLRSSDDITVIARPPWLSVANLIKVVAALLLAVLLAAIWVGLLRRRVRHQSAALAESAAAEAAQERRNTQIEQRRSSILEDINGTRPLAEILEDIVALVSFHLNGAACWCEITDGARLGQPHPATVAVRITREEIAARSGPPLGSIFSAFPQDIPPSPMEKPALLNGARLATLAIETRGLYNDLVHRSEFDLLTDIHNRFSLDKQLVSVIAYARETAGIFGIIFVDLDEFKQVNDVYGHHAGDLYLQEVCRRMKQQLRPVDVLARLGGDEFAVLVPTARTRADVEEIALRLKRSFDQPFEVEGVSIEGSASIGIALYPEDGTTNDSLLSAADAAMYVAKHTRRPADVPTELRRSRTTQA